MANKIAITCGICKQNFLVWPSGLNRKYCSRKCLGKVLGQKSKGANNYFWKGGKKIEIICPSCHKPFSTYESQNRKYCSNKCSGKALSMRTGKLHHLWKQITRKCKMCDNLFEVPPCSKKTHCSKKCRGKNPEFRNKLSKLKKGKSLMEVHGKEKAGEIINKIRVASKNNLNIKRTQFKKGQRAWNKGKCHLSIEARKRISDYQKSNSVLVKKLNFNPLFHKMRLSKCRQKPTKSEVKLILFFEKYSLPFKYVGNGEVMIECYNPDFISINGEKKTIELFGCYWHRCKTCGYENASISSKTEKDEHKIETYKKLGFDILVIWEHELKDETVLLNKIKNYSKIEEAKHELSRA